MLRFVSIEMLWCDRWDVSVSVLTSPCAGPWSDACWCESPETRFCVSVCLSSFKGSLAGRTKGRRGID